MLRYNLRISTDTEGSSRSFILVYCPETHYLYIPDYSPLIYDSKTSLNINYLKKSTILSSRVLSGGDLLASSPLRLNGQRYSQYANLSATGTPDSLEIIVENYTPVICPYTDIISSKEHIGIYFAGITNGCPSLGLESNSTGSSGFPFDFMFRLHFLSMYSMLANIKENQIVLRDSENIYALYKKKDSSNGAILEYEKTSGELPVWTPGLVWVASITASLNATSTTIPSDDLEANTDIIYLSNPVPCSQHDYALIAGQGKTIDLSNINMNIYNLRISDITTQTVVNMTSKSDSKSNIVQPVFFRARELARIVVHPEVTENIAINLDSYKSGVDTFYLKIEGVSFEEIGRTGSGVVFKIKGSLLSNETTSGIYYILNESGDLVTTGKYVYEV